MWVSRRLHIVRTTGKFNVAGEKDLDFSILADHKYVKDLKFINNFNLCRTDVTSFEGCPKMAKVIDIVADGSKISSFKGIKSFPSLRKISIKGTPLSKKKNFILSLLIVAPNISTINGKLISDKTREKAAEFPQFATDLVNNGWIATYPVPDEDQLKSICQEYSVEFNQDDVFIKSRGAEELAKVDEEEDEEFDFENVLANLKEEHESMLVRSQALFGIVEDDTAFNTKLSEVLAAHGIYVDPNDTEGLINTVKDLCDYPNE